MRIAEGYGIKARQVRSRAEYPAALAEMLAYDGPYLLDVI
ncbi:MAG: thiamine pyrophosphate-dependent enzyme [Planctomyces sp.]